MSKVNSSTKSTRPPACTGIDLARQRVHAHGVRDLCRPQDDDQPVAEASGQLAALHGGNGVLWASALPGLGMYPHGS